MSKGYIIFFPKIMAMFLFWCVPGEMTLPAKGQ